MVSTLVSRRRDSLEARKARASSPGSSSGPTTKPRHQRVRREKDESGSEYIRLSVHAGRKDRSLDCRESLPARQGKKEPHAKAQRRKGRKERKQESKVNTLLPFPPSL